MSLNGAKKFKLKLPINFNIEKYFYNNLDVYCHNYTDNQVRADTKIKESTIFKQKNVPDHRDIEHQCDINFKRETKFMHKMGDNRKQ